MYFTQEDYKKIENWLSKKSVKDSDFQEALPLNGEEIITVVQSGHNKKVNIREFIDKIYKYNGSDFTNITNIYKVENITLEEAINFIPIVNRKKGQVITFLNTDSNWEIYQFIGELNQWNNLDFWNNPFDCGTLDYADLVNKPSINGKELNGNTSLKDLGIQPAGNYADKDTVTDVLNSITNINNNLSAINEDINGINTDIGTINDSITGINNDILDINNNLNTHINDVSKFETLFKKFFEYDERNNAIKARLDFYTDTNKSISAGGLNNNIGEIEFISSYSELKDKPFINGQELVSGDNSLDKLGIQPKGNYTTNEFVESLTNAIIDKLNLHIKDFEDFVAKLNTYFQFDSEHQAIKVLYDLYTDKGKNISASGYNNSGTEIIIPTSYPELTDKPKINGIELVGNLTSKDLGLQLEGDYLTISDILNTVKQEDGTTKQYIKSELLPEVKGSNGIEVLQTLSKTNISLLVDTNTFSFGENNELQINKIDGGIF